ncbi:MAG: hypothetical protein JSS87_06390 [Acidobacteria bacterium]|nr:hypothetical protein [Acidobacteriota bacterium]
MLRIVTISVGLNVCCGAFAQAPVMKAVAHPKVTFLNKNPVTGFNSGLRNAGSMCTEDGATIYVQTFDKPGFVQITRVSDSGNVSTRMLHAPLNAGGVKVLDWFVGNKDIVLLIKVWDRSDDDVQHNVRYLLYTMEGLGGSEPDIVSLDVKFRPRNAAIFGNGDLLLTGQDDANDLPELAIVKRDGTVARFYDLSTMRGGVSTYAHDLVNGRFIPYGNDLLLAGSGGDARVLILRANGDGRAITLHAPQGFAIAQILNSGDSGILVVRVRPSGHTKSAEDTGRILEYSAPSGRLLSWLDLDGVKSEDVTCAVNLSLTAITPDPEFKPAENTLRSERSDLSPQEQVPIVVLTSKR